MLCYLLLFLKQLEFLLQGILLTNIQIVLVKDSSVETNFILWYLKYVHRLKKKPT